jgi:hypothetical protein
MCPIRDASPEIAASLRDHGAEVKQRHHRSKTNPDPPRCLIIRDGSRYPNANRDSDAQATTSIPPGSTEKSASATVPM